MARNSVPGRVYICCCLHCNCSSVDSSLSEQLHRFFVPPSHYPLRSLPTHIISLLDHHSCFHYTKQTTLVVAMAMNTRSGAPPTTPAVANRATKSTQARKASKAKSKRLSRPKSNKANATNRVQKRAPTGRKARGYVYIDEDSQTVHTSRTASRDYISDTPIPSRREIPETPPSNQANLEAENARLRGELRHHRHRNHSRQRRSGRDDSEDDSSD